MKNIEDIIKNIDKEIEELRVAGKTSSEKYYKLNKDKEVLKKYTAEYDFNIVSTIEDNASLRGRQIAATYQLEIVDEGFDVSTKITLTQDQWRFVFEKVSYIMNGL